MIQFVQRFNARRIATGNWLGAVSLGVTLGHIFGTTAGHLQINTNPVEVANSSFMISSPVPEPPTWAQGLIDVASAAKVRRRSRRPAA